MAKASIDDLPLNVRTPEEWAAGALRDVLALLNDHAHLERKAAINALEMVNRWPDPVPPENWVRAVSSVASDEAEHLSVVTRMLARRGGRFTKNHRNAYAIGLRGLVRLGDGSRELMDRLMVSALIEARSCERFYMLAAAADEDRELASLYRGLWASEHGHYRLFLDLAREVEKERVVEKRWEEMLAAEGKIIAQQPPGPRMHSWV